MTPELIRRILGSLDADGGTKDEEEILEIADAMLGYGVPEDVVEKWISTIYRAAANDYGA